MIESFLIGQHKFSPKAIAAIVPHAGWAFSGSTACKAISHLQPDFDTIVVVGGHLPPVDLVLCYSEEEYYTPLGGLKTDLELYDELKKRIQLRDDRLADNTVEIQLPFIKHFFPEVKVLGLRVSPTKMAVELGRLIFDAATELKRRIRVVGSTDLTHYGSNYDFSPKGSGRSAVNWVKEVNDKRFIDMLLKMNAEEAIKLSLNENSACSSGGAAAALSYAKASGIKQGRLLKYMTSWDIHPSESFVGYAGIIY